MNSLSIAKYSYIPVGSYCLFGAIQVIKISNYYNLSVGMSKNMPKPNSFTLHNNHYAVINPKSCVLLVKAPNDYVK